jgi:hypothetical protein
MTPKSRALAALAAVAVTAAAAGPVLAAGRPGGAGGGVRPPVPVPAPGGGGGGGVRPPVPVPAPGGGGGVPVPVPPPAIGGAGAINVLMTPTVPFTAVGGANEDPSLAGAVAAVPLFRFQKGVLSVALTNLDPVRFPAGPVGRGVIALGPCSGTVRINGTTKGAISPIPAVAPAVGTQIGFRAAAAAPAGATSHIDLVCNWTDPKLGLQHHETHWDGAMP